MVIFLKKKKKKKKKKDEFRAAFSSQGGSVDVLEVCGGFACFIGHRASGIGHRVRRGGVVCVWRCVEDEMRCSKGWRAVHSYNKRSDIRCWKRTALRPYGSYADQWCKKVHYAKGSVWVLPCFCKTEIPSRYIPLMYTQLK